MGAMRNLFYENLEANAEVKEGKEILINFKLPSIKLRITLPDGVVIVDEKEQKWEGGV